MPTYADPARNKEYSKEYYSKHRSVYLERGRQWDSKNRPRRVEFTLKHRAKNPDAYKAYQKEYGKLWRLKNKEKIGNYNREYQKEYYQKNKDKWKLKNLKRRALEANALVNESQMLAWIKSVKSKRFSTCYYCEREIPTALIHFDHIIALSKGGAHSVENLCVSCPKCNRSKWATPIRAWVKMGQQILEL